MEQLHHLGLRLDLQPLRHPEHGLDRPPARAVGHLRQFKQRRLDPCLEFGVQGGVVGAQQRQQEEHAVLVWQEQLALAQPLAPRLQGVAIQRQCGVVAALEESHRAVQRQAVIIAADEIGAHGVEAVGEQVAAQQDRSQGLVGAVAKPGACLGDDGGQVVIRGPRLRECEQTRQQKRGQHPRRAAGEPGCRGW